MCIEPLIDELVELWNGVAMFDISRKIDGQREFEFHAILVWKMLDAPRLTHFGDML